MYIEYVSNLSAEQERIFVSSDVAILNISKDITVLRRVRKMLDPSVHAMQTVTSRSAVSPTVIFLLPIKEKCLLNVFTNL